MTAGAWASAQCQAPWLQMSARFLSSLQGLAPRYRVGSDKEALRLGPLALEAHRDRPRAQTRQRSRQPCSRGPTVPGSVECGHRSRSSRACWIDSEDKKRTGEWTADAGNPYRAAGPPAHRAVMPRGSIERDGLPLAFGSSSALICRRPTAARWQGHDGRAFLRPAPAGGRASNRSRP